MKRPTEEAKMNKEGFLKELDQRLKYIPKEDREDAIEYYTELISDMELDEAQDVTERLGSPKECAKKILDECTQKHVDEYEENKTIKGHATVVWLTIIGILSLPVSLPLAIAVIAIAIALVVVAAALIISFAAAAIALVISGLVSLVAMWAAPGFSQKLVILGMGLTALAFGTLLGFGVYELTTLIIRKIFRRDKESVKEIKQ